ncbi:MAG: hypothetical protein WAW42_20310, partial [Candidatus Competibacteraceae bacterium]
MARPERFGALSDDDLTNARDLSLRLAEVPRLMEQAPDEVEALAKSARAYHQEFQLRRASADLTGALQQNPDIGKALAGHILLEANGNPRAHQSPEYQRASLSETQLERWLTRGPALLRDHADTLTEEQRTALPLALAALQQESDFRNSTPDWQERNAAIQEQHDPAAARVQAAFKKNPAKVIGQLQAEQLPIIDRLITRLDAQQAPYAQVGMPIPASISRPLTLLQQRKAALQAQMTEQQRAAEAQRQAEVAQQQADYLQQQRAPIPTDAEARSATPTGADPLGDWLNQRATVADEQGQMLKRTLAAMQNQGPQADPAQQQRAEESRRLQAARLTGELIQRGVIEQADVAQVQADIDAWIGRGGMPRQSGVIGQMGQPLGQAPSTPAPAANSGSRAGATNPAPTAQDLSAPADLSAQIAELQAKPKPLASEQARLKRLQNEAAARAGQDELSRLLGSAPTPTPPSAPAPAASSPQS